MRTLAERERRLAIVRAITRVEMLLGTVALIVVLWVVLAPQRVFGGPMLDDEISLFGLAGRSLLFLGVLGVVVGYLWLWRIRYTGPEDGARSNWRSH